MLYRATGRDISEKIALGLAKPTLSKESMLDSRLFNQESLSSSFAADDSYSLYDKPLFSGSSAAAAIYRPRGSNVDEDGNQMVEGGEEGVREGLKNDRFGLGRAGAGRGFEGADSTETRDGYVPSFLSLLQNSTLVPQRSAVFTDSFSDDASWVQACRFREGHAPGSLWSRCFPRSSQDGQFFQHQERTDDSRDSRGEAC